MSNQGYTRRDHRHRKKKSKNRKEIMLDRLLKIFFYILVVLVAIILLKIVFFNNDKDNTPKDNQMTVGDNTTSGTNGLASNGNQTTSSSLTEGNTSTQGSTQGTTEPTSEPVSDVSSEDTTSPTDDTTGATSGEYIPTGDYTVFDDSAFVGDSRIGGLFLSSQLVTSTFYYDVGGNVNSAVDGDGYKLDNGQEGSAIDALKQREFENIFLQYGVNEWGWSTSGFIEGYKNLITEIKAVQPNAKIYVLAIVPVTAEYAVDRADGAMNVNDKLNEMDAELKAMASSMGVGYINIVEGITGGERVLAADMSSDGYHLNRTENLKMLDYICNAIK